MANDYTPESYNSAIAAKTFTGVSAATDLRAQSGYPTHCPQRLDCSALTAGDLVYKDLRGNSNTIQLAAGAILTVDCAVSTLEALTADDMDITAYWWIDSTTRFNP